MDPEPVPVDPDPLPVDADPLPAGDPLPELFAAPAPELPAVLPLERDVPGVGAPAALAPRPADPGDDPAGPAAPLAGHRPPPGRAKPDGNDDDPGGSARPGPAVGVASVGASTPVSGASTARLSPAPVTAIATATPAITTLAPASAPRRSRCVTGGRVGSGRARLSVSGRLGSRAPVDAAARAEVGRVATLGGPHRRCPAAAAAR